MSDQMPDWDLTTTSEDDAGEQSPPNQGDVSALLADSSTLPEPNLWVQTPGSLNLGVTKVDNYSDFFKVLSNFELHSTPPVQETTRIIPEEEEKEKEKGESSWRERKSHEFEHRQTRSEGNDGGMESRKEQDHQQPKRARSTQMHNISERMMSMGGGAPYMSPGGNQNIQVPHFFTFLPIRPRMGMGYGMGMYNIPCSTALPMIPVPSTSFYPSPSAATGLPLMCGSSGVLPVPHVPLPIFSSTFNSSNQGESSSLSVPIIRADFHQLPVINQSGSIATVPASQIIPPSTLNRNQVDVEACGVDSSQWRKGETSQSED